MSAPAAAKASAPAAAKASAPAAAKVSAQAAAKVSAPAAAKASAHQAAAKVSAQAAAKVSAPAAAQASPAVAEVSIQAISIIPILSSELLEGLDEQIRTFSSIAQLRSAVNTRSKQLYQDNTTNINQYLVFQPVTEDDFVKIEEKRYIIGRGVRFTHCTDIDTLIIKVPTPEHERVARAFSYELMDQVRQMGLTERRDFNDMGATAYKGFSTSKEPDSCFKPLAFRPNRLDWPTLVFEVGVSETLLKLKNDARWWLTNSRGYVKIVLLIKIYRPTKTIQIEKWECRPATHAYANRPPAQIPTQIQTIQIDANGVTGSPLATTPPLVLHFQSLFLRQPIPPEQDVTFTGQNLQDLANAIWAALQ